MNRAKKILEAGKQLGKPKMRPGIVRVGATKPPLPPKPPKPPSPPKPNNKKPLLTKSATVPGMTKTKKPSSKKNRVSKSWARSFMNNMTRK
jgi:hypothetical protein